MSALSDIKYALSTEALKSKLNITERAIVLCDIVEALNWDTYTILDENGSFICIDVAEAIKDLIKIDNE